LDFISVNDFEDICILTTWMKDFAELTTRIGLLGLRQQCNLVLHTQIDLALQCSPQRWTGHRYRRDTLYRCFSSTYSLTLIVEWF